MGRDGSLKMGEQNEGVINEECSDVQCYVFKILKYQMWGSKWRMGLGGGPKIA